MSFDISTVEIADTTVVEILKAGGDDPFLVPVEVGDDEGGKKIEHQPATVTVYGPGSKVFKAAQSAQSNRNVDRFKRKGKSKTTAEEAASDTAAFLSAITVSFNNFGYKGMEPDREMFRACYLDPKMGWLTEQVNTAAGDWDNFTKAA